MTLFRHKRILQSGGILLVLVLFLFTGLASVPKAYAESVTVSGVNINATAGYLSAERWQPFLIRHLLTRVS
jgi:hypothetical protein